MDPALSAAQEAGRPMSATPTHAAMTLICFRTLFSLLMVMGRGHFVPVTSVAQERLSFLSP